MKSLLTAAMLLLLGLVTAPLASAGAILYSTTDLGAGSQVEKDASGHVYGLADASGSVVYTFDKAPAIQIQETSYAADPRYTQVLTLQDGTYKVGYFFGSVSGASLFWPSFTAPFTDWFSTNLRYPVVSDLNALGQIVGSSIGVYNTDAKPFATFSAPGLHLNFIVDSLGGRYDDNLNDYIAPIPGVSLISASLIDDVGRIVARGDNGHDYLLTPTTVPEPPAWMMLALASGPLAARSTCRRRESR